MLTRSPRCLGADVEDGILGTKQVALIFPNNRAPLRLFFSTQVNAAKHGFPATYLLTHGVLLELSSNWSSLHQVVRTSVGSQTKVTLIFSDRTVDLILDPQTRRLTISEGVATAGQSASHLKDPQSPRPDRRFSRDHEGFEEVEFPEGDF